MKVEKIKKNITETIFYFPRSYIATEKMYLETIIMITGSDGQLDQFVDANNAKFRHNS